MKAFHRVTSALLALSSLGALLLATMPAHASMTSTQTLTQSLAVPAGTSVSVENLVGHMDISQGGSKLEVTATVVAGGEDQAAADALAKTIKLSVANSGGKVSVHVDYPIDQYDRYSYNRAGDTRNVEDGGDCLFGFICGSSSSSLTYQGERVHVYRHRREGAPLYVDVTVKLPAGANADLTNHVGLIKVVGTKNNLGLHSDNSDMQISQITGNLNADTGSGDIALADQTGPVVIRTGSGDVKIKNVKGNLNIHTGSGDIRGGNAQGDTIETSTGSGDVELSKLTGSLNMKAGSGDIRLSDVIAHGSTEVGTGSGDITLSGDLSGMNGFDLRAGSGDITLATTLPPPVHLDITTGSGDINMHWSGVSNVSTSDDSFSGDIGTAKAVGKIHTGSGDVTLK